jgi:prolipoprotein diacylglyceryltransferase
MVMLLAISAFMHVYYMRNRRPGLSMVVFMYLYSVDRFIIEFFRAESLYEHYLFGLTLAQSTSILVVVATAALHAWILKRTPPGKTPAELMAEPSAKPAA